MTNLTLLTNSTPEAQSLRSQAGGEAIVDVGIGNNGTFARIGVPMLLGANVIEVTAQDVLGNTRVRTTSVARIDATGKPQMIVLSGDGQSTNVHLRLPAPIRVKIVKPDGSPDVVPIHPCWEGATLWFMCGATSVKVRNIAGNSKVALHWQVNESGDGVEMWGSAVVFDDVDTKRRLWNTFDYDLNAFAPDGPDNSPDSVFVSVTIYKALYLAMYGIKGRSAWNANA